MADLRTEHTVWQISGGVADQSYASQFLEYGVALIGLGDARPWQSGRYNSGFVNRFASELKDGDVLLLRIGASVIQAVGLVSSEYQYLSQFDDVNGLDLQHGRRVRWSSLPEPQIFEEQVFGANPARLSQVQSKKLVDYANRYVLSPPMEWQTRPLPNLPVEEPALETFPCELQDLIAQVNDLRDLYVDRGAFGKLPSENEIVAHYVVPFLRALGWPVERIAVEWRNVDVSVFTKLPRIPQHCYYLIEAKRLGAGVEGAVPQAVGYAKSRNIHCDDVVTDGIRYRMYEASKDYAQVAYANLGRLKESSLKLFKRMRKP